MMSLQDDGKGFLSKQSWIAPLSAILIAVGTLSRLAPLTEPHGRLLRQFMTEDGYLMQTVARNLGLGLGLSISDGTIQTNGVQPLATFIFSIFYFLAGGNKVAGVAGVQLFSALASLAAAWLLYRLVRKVLKGFSDGHAVALLTAALWFVAPLTVRHSMNGLETGLYYLVSLATVNVFADIVENGSSPFNVKQMLCLGVMLGLCFLARNDAAFLIAAILASRIVLLWPRSAKAWRERIVEAVVPGLISVLIALPWLIFNYRLFGSIMPISGIAESHDAKLGQNLIYVPAKLLENLLMVPVPSSLETNPVMMLLAVVITAAAIFLAVRTLWTHSQAGPYVVLTYSIFGSLLISFYGIYFGAAYFMDRYLSILSPFLALIGIVAAFRLLMLMRGRLRQAVLMSAGALAGMVMLGLNGTLYYNGLHHLHFQVVDWVDAHVEPDTWVGAIQTGTLGFFHDKTINLDGKVDPFALRERIDHGDVISYILASHIVFLADWFGIASWSEIKKEGFNRQFEIIVADEKANLGVLKRIGDGRR